MKFLLEGKNWQFIRIFCSGTHRVKQQIRQKTAFLRTFFENNRFQIKIDGATEIEVADFKGKEEDSQ